MARSTNEARVYNPMHQKMLFSWKTTFVARPCGLFKAQAMGFFALCFQEIPPTSDRIESPHRQRPWATLRCAFALGRRTGEIETRTRGGIQHLKNVTS